MKIRPICVDDYAAVYELMLATDNIDKHTPYTLWQAATFDSSLFWVATEDSQVAGYVFGRVVSADTVFLWQIAVDANHQGKRVGNQLVHAFIESAQSQGFKKLTTTISKGNTASERLFQRIAAAYQQELLEIGSTGTFGQTMSNEVCYQMNLPALEQ